MWVMGDWVGVRLMVWVIMRVEGGYMTRCVDGMLGCVSHESMGKVWEWGCVSLNLWVSGVGGG